MVIVVSALLSIGIASIRSIFTDLSPRPSIGLSVCLSVQKVYCGKTAELIRMPFGMVSGVGRRIGVFNGVVIIEGEEAVLRVNLGHPIVTNGNFVA